MSRARTVVVGGGLAGMRTAEALSTKGFDGEVVVLSDESERAYNRPPLSKSALRADVTSDDVPLRMRKTADFEWRLETRVVDVDLDSHVLRLSDDTTLDYDHLVAASGVRPRRLDLAGPSTARHVVRTVADARALAQALSGTGDVVILGAGFLGTELAWTIARFGRVVTVVAPEAEPLVGAIGAPAAAALRRRSESAGVMFRNGRTATHVVGESAPRAVVLDNGEVLAASVVIEAVGSAPNVDWLRSTALDVTAGIEVDDRLGVVGASNFWAVGDVASAPQALLHGRRRRLEHWTHAGESARHVAAAILGSTEPFVSVPGFWTEQGGIRLDGYGFPGAADDHVLVAGDWDEDFLARSEFEGKLIGFLAAGFVKESAPLIKELSANAAAAHA
ncbi:NAD(P)/FAD-dependent oxidoreductase [Gordonia sp. KTR9]|uniref:NAD(P)/FAD-dependent oxidoreductase n=1 Tax=Gordonia sp. KTR9 TaxID=337191 RepID=UPI00027DDEAD|nr:NAD(P)/FAD-dependent oxidoreductase [Gordonia sp. KTR9]AFR49480.1 putative NAD(FAD)-dependent dehydrogenase [Gordonia sp. KTR9]